MNIVDLAILKKMVSGGGGSGTDNYNDLLNLPQINGETLAGNKTAENLGLQDALTFDSAPTEDSTNPVESGGVFNALAGKQDNLTFDGTYDASINKAATESTVTNAIAGLDVSALSVDADETISSISETDGKISVTKQDIAIASNQVVAMAGYTKPSSAPATPAIQQGDTANAAIGKLEFKADTNQTNILLVQDATEELVDAGAKNRFDDVGWMNYTSVIKGTKSISNGAITITATDNDCYTDYYTSDYLPIYDIPVNEDETIVLSWEYVANSSQSNDTVYLFDNALTPVGNVPASQGYITYTIPTGCTYLRFRLGVSTSGNSATYSKIMATTKAEYDISDEYEPHALPNYDLTRLQSEDRAALAEVVDEGAKNKLCLDLATIKALNPDGTWNGNTFTRDGLTFTINADMTISASGTASANVSLGLYSTDNTSFNGDMILSGCPNGGDYYTKYSVYIADSQGSTILSTADSNGTLIAANTVFKYMLILVRSGTNVTGLTFKPMICTLADWKVSQNYAPFALPNTDLTRMMTPFFTVPINHNMIYRGQNLGETFTEAQDTALSSGNFTDLYLGDYWTKTVTIPDGTYTGGDGEEVTVPAQTNITLKAVIADFDTFYAGYASSYAGINTHHAAVIVTGFSNVVWNKTNSTAGGYVASLIHKWLVGSALPQIETWFGSAKVLSHQKLLTNAITGDAASGWAWSSQKISLLSENQMYGSKVWGNSKAANGGYEPGEAFKHLNVFNHIDANLLFGNKNIWLRDIASAVGSADLGIVGFADNYGASNTGVAPAALILLS